VTCGLINVFSLNPSDMFHRRAPHFSQSFSRPSSAIFSTTCSTSTQTTWSHRCISKCHFLFIPRPRLHFMPRGFNRSLLNSRHFFQPLARPQFRPRDLTGASQNVRQFFYYNTCSTSLQTTWSQKDPYLIPAIFFYHVLNINSDHEISQVPFKFPAILSTTVS
jgi:hypothetical protein